MCRGLPNVGHASGICRPLPATTETGGRGSRVFLVAAKKSMLEYRKLISPNPALKAAVTDRPLIGRKPPSARLSPDQTNRSESGSALGSRQVWFRIAENHRSLLSKGDQHLPATAAHLGQRRPSSFGTPRRFAEGKMRRFHDRPREPNPAGDASPRAANRCEAIDESMVRRQGGQAEILPVATATAPPIPLPATC